MSAGVVPASAAVAPCRSGGFTLVELVSVLVILGVLAAVALPLYRDFRYDARVAAMRQIGVAIQTNHQAAVNAYLARPSAGAMQCQGQATESAVVGGRQISMAPVSGATYAPTGCGMFVLLGCGTHADADAQALAGGNTGVRCTGLPGYRVVLTAASLDVWPDGGADRGETWCTTIYNPANGFGPQPLGDVVDGTALEYGWQVAIEYFFTRAGGTDAGGWSPGAVDACD